MQLKSSFRTLPQRQIFFKECLFIKMPDLKIFERSARNGAKNETIAL